jgi:hypothetical protein
LCYYATRANRFSVITSNFYTRLHCKELLHVLSARDADEPTGNAAADILLPLIYMASVTIVLLPVLITILVQADMHEVTPITDAAQAAGVGTMTLQPITETITIVCHSR